MRSKILVALAVVGLGFFAVASGTALAAPGGGKGHGKGGKAGTTTGTCTLTVTPNPAPQQTNIALTGAGFLPSTQLNIVQDGVVFLVFSGTDGTMTLPLWSGLVGTHNVAAKQLVNGSYVLCGSTTYQAY